MEVQQVNPEGEIREYEMMVILDPDLGEAGISEITEQVKKIIEANGGSDTQIDQWATQELRYPIRKRSRGFYQVFHFNGTGATVRELERSLRLNDRVLRVVSVRRTKEGAKLPPRNLLGSPKEEPAVSGGENNSTAG